MRRALVALLLCACVKTPDVLPNVQIPLRNPTSPVASQADAQLNRLHGDWRVVQGAGIAPGSVITITPTALKLDGVVLPLVDKGAGRFLMGGEEIWIHWLDYDNRTAVLGEPGGKRVWIMDRTGNPAERLKAAREILTWYGYDLGRMEGT